MSRHLPGFQFRISQWVSASTFTAITSMCISAEVPCQASHSSFKAGRLILTFALGCKSKAWFIEGDLKSQPTLFTDSKLVKPPQTQPISKYLTYTHQNTHFDYSEVEHYGRKPRAAQNGRNAFPTSEKEPELHKNSTAVDMHSSLKFIVQDCCSQNPSKEWQRQGEQTFYSEHSFKNKWNNESSNTGDGNQ